MHSASTAQVFKEPGHAASLACVVTAQLLFAMCAAVDPDLLDFGGFGLIALACCFGMVLLFFWTYFQQVVIDGTFVRIRNSTSFFRWRGFDISDVVQVRYQPLDSDAQFQSFLVTLKPATSRAWTQLRLKTHDPAGKYKGIDAAVMLAFMHAVVCVHPNLHVANLPPNYRGALPRARRTVEPALPPGSGKTRKRKQAAVADEANKKRRAKEKVRPEA